MVIPYEQLAADTLRAVIEEYVSREGTDYGEQAFTLDQKVAQIMTQLRQKRAVLVFDDKTETCHVVLRETVNEE